MKTLNKNHLVLALFTALAMNASWNIYSSEQGGISSFELASKSSCTTKKNAKGDSVMTCHMKATKKDGDIQQAYGYKYTITKTKGAESSIKDFGEAGKTEAGFNNQLESFLGSKTQNSTDDKIDLLEIKISRTDCHCFGTSSIVKAATSIASIEEAINQQITANADNSFDDDKNKLEKAKAKKIQDKKDAKKIAACEMDSSKESLKTKSRLSDRVECIKDRISEFSDEKKAKSFWNKNKKHITKYLKTTDEDQDEITDMLTDISDSLIEHEGLERQAHSVGAMLQGGLAHKDIVNLAGRLQNAQLNNDSMGELALTELINSRVTRFNNAGYMFQSAGSQEFSSWNNHITSLGRSAANNPGSVLQQYTDIPPSSIARMQDYRNAVGVGQNGFNKSRNNIISTGNQRVTPVAPFSPVRSVPSVATQQYQSYNGRTQGRNFR